MSNMALQENVKNNQVNIQALGTYLAQVMTGLDNVGREISENGMQIKENGMQIKENGIQLKELQKEIKEANKQYGYLSNSIGKNIEDLIVPNLDHAIFQAFNVEIEGIHPNIMKKKIVDGNKKKKEFDIVAIADEEFFIIETKKTIIKEHVDAFEDLVSSGELLTWFPEYKDFKITQIMASLSIEKKMFEYIKSKGIYPMIMKGDILKIILTNTLF